MHNKYEAATAFSNTSTTRDEHDSYSFPTLERFSEQPWPGEWSQSAAKRAFDVFGAAFLLVVIFPFILITAIAVKLTSRGPVLFRQTRVGKGGSTFLMFKFRTMGNSFLGGPSVTKVGDTRLTPIGASLRRFKLDELPQLVNVLRGDMSLVGPRPKVPHHETQPLKYRPGVTGAASIAFRKEEELLRRLPDNSLDDYQVRVMMPMKRKLDDEYMQRATFTGDLSLMLHTALGKGNQIQEADLLLFADLLFFQDSLVSLGSALSSAGTASPYLRQTLGIGHVGADTQRHFHDLVVVQR